MYLQHFGLSEKPFSLTPDTQLFFDNECHIAAFNTIVLALGEGEGFLKIVGEVGTGKTLLCRKLLSFLHQSAYVTAYIPNPWLNADELKHFLAMEIGVELDGVSSSHEITAAIYRKLVQLARQDKKVVLIIDEAQAMPIETIESLRLLTNLESEKRKLLHVVVFGQPELDEILARKDLRQLQQRIIFSERLAPLKKQAVSDYMQHRLAQVGGGRIFSAQAIWLIRWASKGIPRLINILAHKSLICAYGKSDRLVQLRHTAKAVMDTPEALSNARAASYLLQYLGRQGPQRSVRAVT